MSIRVEVVIGVMAIRARCMACVCLAVLGRHSILYGTDLQRARQGNREDLFESKTMIQLGEILTRPKITLANFQLTKHNLLLFH